MDETVASCPLQGVWENFQNNQDFGELHRGFTTALDDLTLQEHVHDLVTAPASVRVPISQTKITCDY
jgi:hypothetical protein